MQKIFRTWVAAAALFVASSAMSPQAEAMPMPGGAGLSAALADADLAHEVAYVCRRVWRCGYDGCGWRRSCWWRPGPAWGDRDWDDYGYRRPWWPHRRWHRDWD
jgi:hypothetical protein